MEHHNKTSDASLGSIQEEVASSMKHALDAVMRFDVSKDQHLEATPTRWATWLMEFMPPEETFEAMIKVGFRDGAA